MELPAAGEHVFAVEGIEKKRIRKVCRRRETLSEIRLDFCFAMNKPYNFFLPSPIGKNRVPGQVARLVSEVSLNILYANYTLNK